LQRRLVNDLHVYVVPPTDSGVCRPTFPSYEAIKPKCVVRPAGGSAPDTTMRGGVWSPGISPDSILAHPAQPGIDTLNNTERVVVVAPAAGNWTIVVEGADIVQNQAKSGSTGDPRQDFSVVSDATPSEDAGSSPDVLGPLFKYGDHLLARHTKSGFLQTVGPAVGTQVQGLRFGSNASLDTARALHASVVVTDQGWWLDNPNNLAGGLVLRNAAGQATMHVSTSGSIRLRGRHFERMGAF
jgi:hypothetical protein